MKGAHLLVGAAVCEGKVGDLASDLLAVLLSLAVVAVEVVLGGVLVGGLFPLDDDLDILVLIVVDLGELEDEAVVLEVKEDLTEGLAILAVVVGLDQVPRIALTVVVIGEEEGLGVRDVVVLAALAAAVEDIAVATPMDVLILVVSELLVSSHAQDTLKGVEQRETHDQFFTSYLSE